MKQPPVISSKSRRNTDEPREAYIGSKMPSFGAIPQNLLLDPTISPQAKAVYGVFHVYCSVKKICNGSFTFVSQIRIAMENLGRSQQYVCTLTKELRDSGWMTIIRRGQGRSNINILHASKGQKITDMDGNEFTIIGVVEDFHFESLHKKLNPLIIHPYGLKGFGWYLSVRVNAENVKETIASIKRTWEKYALNQAFEYEFSMTILQGSTEAKKKQWQFFSAFPCWLS